MTDSFDIARSCGSKNRYATEDTARLVAESAWRKRRHALRVYLCEKCGGYHLTHMGADRPTGNFRPARKSARQLARERNKQRDWNRRRTK